MSRNPVPPLLAILLLAGGGGLLVACQDDAGSDRASQEAESRREEQREIERMRREDREFERAFKETPYDKLLGRLPIREPPLYVEQYITVEGGRHKVYTAVSRKRFCRVSPTQRQAAVEAFYRDADALFRRNGISDFVQVVTPVSQTAETFPALAVGRNGSASLTRRGRTGAFC